MALRFKVEAERVPKFVGQPLDQFVNKLKR